MTSVTSWSPVQVETVWATVAAHLKAELGEGPFNSYVAPSHLRVGNFGEPILVTPTNYARDWILRHAVRRANELWLANDPEQRTLDIRSRADLDGQGTITPMETIAPSAKAAFFTPPVSPCTSRVPGLQERLTFDSFVEGRANEFAHSVAKKIACFEDVPFNPIFFHGPYGQGKTHLINAIGWAAQNARPEAKIVYLTAEKFTSTFVKAIMDKSTSAFKDEIRGADLLLVDDVHFIGGKTSSQEELFHTLTTLIENNRRVVFTADRPPSQLTEVEVRLRSYLSSGPVCALDVADSDLRIGIIERKLEQLKARIGLKDLPRNEVLHFLADRVPGSIRELEGAVNTLAASAGARLGSLTLEEAMALLQPNLKVAVERRITVDEIQKLTAEHFGLKQTDLLSERRTRTVARPRQVAMWLCKQNTTRSYPDIGRRFGGRDHTTVLHAVKKIEQLISTDDQISRDIEALTRKLRNGQ
jgi:chromosomal replication initiator protein